MWTSKLVNYNCTQFCSLFEVLAHRSWSSCWRFSRSGSRVTKRIGSQSFTGWRA